MRVTGGSLLNRRIECPPGIIRPAMDRMRESMFSILNSRGLITDAVFLDLFAGSGIMGLEALSRGFEHVVAIEKNPKVYNILLNNYKALKVKPNILKGDSLKVIPQEHFDVIYMDPPYYSGVYEKSLEVLPDCKIVILEHTTDVDFSGYEVIKQKKYGDKTLTYLRKA